MKTGAGILHLGKLVVRRWICLGVEYVGRCSGEERGGRRELNQVFDSLYTVNLGVQRAIDLSMEFPVDGNRRVII